MKKNILLIAAAAVLVVALALAVRIQSPEEYYQTHSEDPGEDAKTVTLSICCGTLLEPDNWEKLDAQLKNEKYVPADGVILPETTYAIQEGDTVFDVLKRACQDQEIQLEYTGPDTSAYSTVFIEGINYLYDFSCGELSGWMYRVNDDFPSKGCSAYVLEDGDQIEWVYTCDLGRDVGDNYIDRTSGSETVQEAAP